MQKWFWEDKEFFLSFVLVINVKLYKYQKYKLLDPPFHSQWCDTDFLWLYWNIHFISYVYVASWKQILNRSNSVDYFSQKFEWILYLFDTTKSSSFFFLFWLESNRLVYSKTLWNKIYVNMKVRRRGFSDTNGFISSEYLQNIVIIFV